MTRPLRPLRPWDTQAEDRLRKRTTRHCSSTAVRRTPALLNSRHHSGIHYGHTRSNCRLIITCEPYVCVCVCVCVYVCVYMCVRTCRSHWHNSTSSKPICSHDVAAAATSITQPHPHASGTDPGGRDGKSLCSFFRSIDRSNVEQNAHRKTVIDGHTDRQTDILANIHNTARGQGTPIRKANTRR